MRECIWTRGMTNPMKEPGMDGMDPSPSDPHEELLGPSPLNRIGDMRNGSSVEVSSYSSPPDRGSDHCSRPDLVNPDDPDDETTHSALTTSCSAGTGRPLISNWILWH